MALLFMFCSAEYPNQHYQYFSLYRYLLEPKPQPPRWISNSVLQVQWETDSARLCFAEYHTNIIDISVSVQVLPEPKPRSARWISSSVPQAQWETDSARLCSAEYHTNNLLNPVLFEDACKHIPNVSTIKKSLSILIAI